MATSKKLMTKEIDKINRLLQIHPGKIFRK